MPYFSRLTDIITCNLTQLLQKEADPDTALEQIICEMEEGLAGAKRSWNAARANEERLRNELEELRRQRDDWAEQARQAVAAGRENDARLALYRKNEVSDLIAGVEQQVEAAVATREHLTTTLRAIEARLADARRRQRDRRRRGEAASHQFPASGQTATVATAEESSELAADRSRAEQIERELEELKQSLRRNSTH
ncbi:MAG: PspA/IM30 family protein [Planctomycetes bacterium]|nr:PspA/IM30 family protein [Planctomycetota bacterium]